MTVEIPDMIRRAMEAQGKYDPDAVAAEAAELIETGELDKPEAAPAPIPAAPPAAAQESLLEPPAGHELHARGTDPPNSHESSRDVAEREGTTGTITPGTHKHLILAVYGAAERPLTDTEAWTQAGLHPRSCGWHRCSDLLDGGFIRHVRSVPDDMTGALVRGCAITLAGMEALAKLEKGKPVTR